MNCKKIDVLNECELKTTFRKYGIELDFSLVECESTQQYARDISVAKDTLIVAMQQGKGIGRMGRRFVSHNGGAYFSLILVGNKEKELLQYVPTISVAVATVIDEYVRNVSIKWPNDIFIGNKKVCGIICHKHSDRVVIGVGVNIFNDISEIAEIATSLSLEGVKITRVELVAKLIKKFYEMLKVDFSEIRMVYNNFLNISDKNISVVVGNKSTTGRVVGINENGFLLLKTSEKKQCIVSSGDIVVDCDTIF